MEQWKLGKTTPNYGAISDKIKDLGKHGFEPPKYKLQTTSSRGSPAFEFVESELRTRLQSFRATLDTGSGQGAAVCCVCVIVCMCACVCVSVCVCVCWCVTNDDMRGNVYLAGVSREELENCRQGGEDTGEGGRRSSRRRKRTHKGRGGVGALCAVNGQVIDVIMKPIIHTILHNQSLS